MGSGVWSAEFENSATSSCAEGALARGVHDSSRGCYKSVMEKATIQQAQSLTDSDTARFERPSIEEISLCCEISAYAPDGDDRPLF